MATAVPQTPAPVVEVTPPDATPSSRRRWGLRLLLVFVGGLGVAAWFAPLIVAQTSLRHRVPRLLFPTYPGAMEVGSATLGWLQPVVARDLKARDEQGQLLLEVKEFSTSLPLWKLAVDRSSLGRLTLVEPQVSVELRPGGSNLEDVLEKFLSGPPSSSPASFELAVNGATVVLDHKLASLTSTIAPVALVLQSRRGDVEELQLTVGQVPAPDEPVLEPPTDWLAFLYGSVPTQEGVAMTPGSKHLRLKADRWKLDKLLPALARFEPGAELSGAIDADARGQFNLADSAADWSDREWSWDGRITVTSFVLAGIAPLKQDRVELNATSLSGRLAAQQGRLSMDRVQLQTEVGELTATGDLPLKGLGSASPFDAARSILGEQDYLIHGHLDLRQLATLLPNTLRVQEGTEITGGRLELDLKSEAREDGTRHWTADTAIDDLTALNQGKVVAWAEPVRLNMQAHRGDDMITIDRITCQSDFFELSGRGTVADAQFSASGDLTRLEEQLQQFVDLGIDKLAGKVKAQGAVRRLEADRVAIEASIQLDDFEWNIARAAVWQEPRLVLTVNADGRTVDDSRLTRIESAELKLTSGQDTLVSTLQSPVDLTAEGIAWPVKAALDGDLRTWQNRLRPFVALGAWQLAGKTRIDAALTASTKQIEVENLVGNVTTLEARNPGLWWIKEPQFKLETAGVWSIAQSEWTAPQSIVTGTAIACRVKDLQVDLAPDGQLERVTGNASYRGDLDKLSRWKNQALSRPYYHLMGIVEGQSHLVENDSSISLDVDAKVTKLVVADLETTQNQQLHWVALWREPELRILGKGRYDVAADQLQIETASLAADGLTLNAHGSLAELSSTQRIDLKGELGYDWDLVSQRMGESLRESIQLKGRQTRPLAFKGSLASLGGVSAGQTGQRSPVDLSGTGGVGWDSAVVEGLVMGPADVTARLEKGICQFTPISTTLSGGTLHLTPQIRLDRDPALVVLPAEKVIDHVQISPEMCDAWLKYVAPLLADATQIDGQFSLDVQAGALPLTAPTTGQLGGVLGVHQAKVRPGGAALQVTGLIEQIKSLILRKPAGNAPQQQVWMRMPEQKIPFRLAGGRVHHELVTFLVGEATVLSSGSVGMDETIDLVLQIPVQDDWVKDQKVLAGLKGKSLKVPVRGTLSRPQFDSRVLTELATQIGGSALEGVIEDQLDDLFKKKLNRFLPGQK